MTIRITMTRRMLRRSVDASRILSHKHYLIQRISLQISGYVIRRVLRRLKNTFYKYLPFVERLVKPNIRADKHDFLLFFRDRIPKPLTGREQWCYSMVQRATVSVMLFKYCRTGFSKLCNKFVIAKSTGYFHMQFLTTFPAKRWNSTTAPLQTDYGILITNHQ